MTFEGVKIIPSKILKGEQAMKFYPTEPNYIYFDSYGEVMCAIHYKSKFPLSIKQIKYYQNKNINAFEIDHSGRVECLSYRKTDISKTIDKIKTENRRIEYSISRAKREVEKVEGYFIEAAKGCKVEWLRPKWMKGRTEDKIKEIKYWLT